MKKKGVKDGVRRNGWKTAIIWGIVFFVLLSLLLYFRRFNYNLYIANKAIASAAVMLIGVSFLIGPLARFWPDTWVSKLYLRKHFGVFGFAVAVLHIIITLILLSPEQYPKLYTEAGTLNATAQWSLLLGTLAILMFAVISITSIPSIERAMSKRKWLIIQRTGYLAFLFVLIHLVQLKYKGWINLDNWLNGLPPGSLVPFVFILIVFFMRFLVMISPVEFERE
tara:strand:+ start:12 stop:683 length:672 start_codon:yes stop_codon:yes gene_type:complete